MNNTYKIQHPDDGAVDRFAVALKAKMAESRAKGRNGWDNEVLCPNGRLPQMLREHVAKGDPRDVGVLAMMCWARGESTSTDGAKFLAHLAQSAEAVKDFPAWKFHDGVKPPIPPEGEVVPAKVASIDTPDFQQRFSYMLLEEYKDLIAHIDAKLAEARQAGRIKGMREEGQVARQECDEVQQRAERAEAERDSWRESALAARRIVNHLHAEAALAAQVPQAGQAVDELFATAAQGCYFDENTLRSAKDWFARGYRYALAAPPASAAPVHYTNEYYTGASANEFFKKAAEAVPASAAPVKFHEVFENSWVIPELEGMMANAKGDQYCALNIVLMILRDGLEWDVAADDWKRI